MLPRFLYNPINYDYISNKNECIVIGSGIAGLSTAIRLSKHIKIKIFTKSALSESNTWYAQGGIAAVIKGPDSWQYHYTDTIKSGQGLCDSQAVETLVKSAPEMIEDLIENGINFDIANGEISLTLEGGHSSARVLHAGGDATGEEIERKLIIYAKQQKNIEFYPEYFVLDILKQKNECFGVTVLNINEKKIEVHPCSSIIISTGGVGQLFELTTNPSVSTGDGIAMAYRAGTEIKDIEFIQFHPTVFKTNDGKLFLITEALRGEGAFLRDSDGNRFMVGKHPLAELAPRDIVVKEMTMVMKEKGIDYVYLDATHLDAHMLAIRFPNIVNKLKENGLDLKVDLIKVSPAAHYLNGGIKTNLNGETNIKGIYACGETAATGAHGANRLASNSLIEGLVFGYRIYESILNKIKNKNIAAGCNNVKEPDRDKEKIAEMFKKIVEDELFLNQNFFTESIAGRTKGIDPGTANSLKLTSLDEIENHKIKLRHFMTNRVGILREEGRLKNVLEFVNGHICDKSLYNRKEREPAEFLNMLYVARLIITAAIIRTESRGTHQRCDWPETDDTNWKKHIIEKDGEIYFEPVI
ncbi:MAG: L-aspartate oxidase [Candidatus Humimicrobiaceae bacterium]